MTAATSLAILLYAVHNGAAALAAFGGGHLADRVDPRMVFAAGGVMYVAGYGLFAAGLTAWPVLAIAFVLAGVGIGFGETAESTVVGRGLPERLRSNGFGVLGLTQAVGDIGSTVVAGLLWATVSPLAAFAYAGAWMAASVISAGLLATRHSTEDGGDAR
jgi:MFS family permease